MLVNDGLYTMESSYYARLRRMMILACRRNKNFASNIHAPATQGIFADRQLKVIFVDLQLDRGIVLDRQTNMSYYAYNRSNLVVNNFKHIDALRGKVYVM